MATTPDLQESLITAARAQAWHQTGEALLTLEAARTWLNTAGLLLFAPRGGSLGAPAPSLVEATLGAAKATATLAETQTARTLAARLVGEGSALPLNLLGGPGDVPDFLVSAHSFPFVFTLRGDKGWKRPPETSGPVKVTPLGLRVYELIAEKGALTVADIVSEAGREVTESAVARALGELWQLLRVIPVLQQGAGETRWELTTTRFIKAVKAGANAGQPTALSGLISLYLHQVYTATEEEIAAFLSPLTARSRVREALHGLSAGRQLTEGVINGKTVLYIPEALPDFAAFTPEATEEPAAEADATAEAAAPGPDAEASEDAQAPRERIRTFDGGDTRSADRNLRGKPLSRAKSAASSDTPARPSRDSAAGRGTSGRPPFRPNTGEASEGRGGTGRTYGRPRQEGAPSFTRPWDEERGSRPPRPRGEGDAGSDAGARSARPGRPPREPRGDRPFRDAGAGDARSPRRFDDRPRRTYTRQDDSQGVQPGRSRAGFSGGDRPERPFRERPAGDRPFRPRTSSGDRPFRPRPDGDRPFRPRPDGDRPFRARPEGGERPFHPRTENGDRPFRPRTENGDRPFRPRAEGDRPSRPRPQGDGDRPFRPKTGSGERPFRPKTESGDRPFRPRNDNGERPFKERSQGSDRPFRARPQGGDRPFRPAEGSAGERRGPGRPPSRFKGGEGRPSGPRPGSSRPRSSEGGEGGSGRSRPAFGGGGRSGDRRPFGGGARPAPRGGSRPPAKRTGGAAANRPDRPARKPRPEDEA